MGSKTLAAVMLAVAMAACGCGARQVGTTKPAGTASQVQPQAKVTAEKTPIGTTKLVSQGEVPPRFEVTDMQGKKVTLDLHDGPVLVSAWWCPHCAALLARNDLPGLPRVVTVWPQAGQTMKQILQAEQSMMKADGWQGNWRNGLFAADTVPGVNSVPTLLFVENGQVKQLGGESMPAADVAKALGGKVVFSKTRD